MLEALNIGFLSYGHGRNLGLVLYWVGIFLLAAAWVLLPAGTAARFFDALGRIATGGVRVLFSDIEVPQR